MRFATKTSHFTKNGGGERTTDVHQHSPAPRLTQAKAAGFRVGRLGFFMIKTTQVLPVTPRRSQDAHGGGRQKTLRRRHRERLRDAAVTAGSSVFAARGRALGARSGAASPLGSKFFTTAQQEERMTGRVGRGDSQEEMKTARYLNSLGAEPAPQPRDAARSPPDTKLVPSAMSPCSGGGTRLAKLPPGCRAGLSSPRRALFLGSLLPGGNARGGK